MGFSFIKKTMNKAFGWGHWGLLFRLIEAVAG
jgi:hypothetical protein